MKTTADICFLVGSFVDWRKISDEFAQVRVEVIFGRFKVTQ